MKVAFCCSEAFPFAKTGGLADVCGALPIALERLGVEVVLFMPHYASIDHKENYVKRISQKVSLSKIGQNISVYLVESDQYFDRKGLYGDGKADYPDNCERYHYFCEQSLELLKELNFRPNVIHCHDWQTALISIFLKKKFAQDEFFAKTKSLLTIHNMAYQGVFPAEKFKPLGLPADVFSPHGLEFYGKINLLKGGIIFCDKLNTVSPQYAQEILTKEFGCGLEGVTALRKDRLSGILNGVDYHHWNPDADIYIDKTFNAQNFRINKGFNKTALQATLNLPVQTKTPLFGFVARLSQQKGLDLILESMAEFLKMDIQMVFLGVGDEKYEQMLIECAQKYPQKVAFSSQFNEKLSHQIYAGTDFFLMPSLFEPCGLSQMISLRYGSIPIVFKTGGLADTIQHFEPTLGIGNGIVFEQYSKQEFIKSIYEALDNYKDKDSFDCLRENALRSNFSWDASAQEYYRLYQWLLWD